MKSMVLFFFIILGIAARAQVIDTNIPSKKSVFFNKTQVNVLSGKPISYYLNHQGIDKATKRFYKGELGLSNFGILKGVMDSLISCSSEIQPFYFFVFNQIVNISLGAQEDVVAATCKVYVEKYPCEFFESFNRPEIEINVVKWTYYIGLTLKDKANYAVFRNNVDSSIKHNCGDFQDLIKSFMAEVRMCLVK